MTSGNGLDRYPESDCGRPSSTPCAETRVGSSYVVIGPGFDLYVGVDFELSVGSEGNLVPGKSLWRRTPGHVAVLVIARAVTRACETGVGHSDNAAEVRAGRRYGGQFVAIAHHTHPVRIEGNPR